MRLRPTPAAPIRARTCLFLQPACVVEGMLLAERLP